jgi:hypothetical protein
MLEMAICNGLGHPKWDGKWCDVCHFPSIPTHQLDAHRYSGTLFRQAEQTRNAPSRTDSRLSSRSGSSRLTLVPRDQGMLHMATVPGTQGWARLLWSFGACRKLQPAGQSVQQRKLNTPAPPPAAEEQHQEEDDNNCLRERPHGLGILRVWRWAAEEVMEEAMSAKWNPRKRCRGVATQSSSITTRSSSGSSGIGE